MQGLPLKIVQEALRAARSQIFVFDENQNDSFSFQTDEITSST